MEETGLSLAQDAFTENEPGDAAVPPLSVGEIAGRVGLKCIPVCASFQALSEQRESLLNAAEAQAVGHDELADLYAQQGKSKGQQALELILPSVAAAVAWVHGGPVQAAVVLGVMQATQAAISEGGDLYSYTKPIRALVGALRPAARAAESQEEADFTRTV